MMKQKLKTTISILILLTTPLGVFAQVDPNFDPNKLIDDKVFSDIQTFGGAAGIQKFLEVKGSVLANTSPSFIAKLKEPDAIILKQGLEDPEPNLGRLRTAAELIWDASRQSGLNPQVIIVTLNKEQGLITAADTYNDAKLQKALDRAMGFDCPDGSGCGDLFPGFYYQLFGNFDSAGNRYIGAAKSLMKSYSATNGRGPIINGVTAHVGDTVTIENTLGGPQNPAPSQSVTLSNLATAALYRYTPHVYNGNYNFWKYFMEWFRYPNGTLIKLANGVDTYIIQNGVKQLVPNFVALARNLNLNNTVIASPTEFESYQTDKMLGPVDNTIVSVIGENKTYVFINNVKHPASNFVITQRGLDPNKVLSISAIESSLFDAGSVLPPNDGTVIKGATDPGIYLVQDGKIKLYSAYTFAQAKISAKKVVTVPDEEILTYEKNGFVPPLDGTLIKANNDATVYLVENGLKHPVLGEIFKIRGFSFKKVVSLSPEEVAGLTIGSYATPADRTFFAAGSLSGQAYMFKEGTKHPISPFVAKQRGLTPDYAFADSVVIQWFDGIPVSPANNTIIKGDSSATIYLVVGGQLRPMTAKAFANRKIKAKQIVTLPQAEVDAYAKGDALLK